jgi:choline dehydrogenase-like flavoprotein
MLALRGDPALYESWGWGDTEIAWNKVEIPCEAPRRGELGPVDLALLAADDRAEIAMLTRKQGRRITSAEAYLWPLVGSSNLSIRADTAVRRVLLDQKRARGVELANGEVLDADRVVVAAGAIHTPAILLRSGVDTPGVGVGLQDHPSAAFALQLQSGVAREAGGLAIGSLLHRGKIQLLPMNHLADDNTSEMGLLMVALMAPVGRGGSVLLDPDCDVMQPAVNFEMLSDERDVASLCHGVHHAINLLRTPAFQTIVESIYIDEFGTTLDRLVDDDSIASWVRSSCGDYVHASSSCAMGRVVDQDGAVFGYEALTVCDASVFPSIPHVNTHLPTTMLAERLSARWCERERMTP